MKNILKLSSIAFCFLTLTFTGNLIAEGSESGDSRDKAASRWLQYSTSVRKPVATTLNIEAEGDVVEGIIVGSLKVKQEFLYLKCCGPDRNKDSWCDAALQDKRC